MAKNNFTIKTLIFLTLILLAFLWAINPEIRTAISIDIVFLLIALFVYSAKEYKRDVNYYNNKSSFTAILFGTLSVGLFYILTKFVPGLSLAFPSLPQTIGTSLRFFLVVLVAPPVEEIFFRGAVLGILKSLFSTGKAVVIQAFIFSIFHLGAYITGFYKLPNFATGLQAIYSNILVFLVAFIFALIVGFVIEKSRSFKGNLWFSTTLHLGINLISYSLAIITFV